ncbi:hypothetical protein LTS08_002291 [Lithohypha guttulata]|uniref:C2H2-type domain-containing protein n=1 Tax=Lithohypha guttulata TaxID=1690604 RepID=A0AAN7T6W5_9EURO|nr:hypothetical protein LTR51_004191 [Lithohypha guttulata]KAK5090799.1 hypothetical protein LTR05_000976 [Lithohypha guttulata]KAK5104403.1 hypothetical protein LTS08_002291 [Lithohypha guttulata]
MPRAEAGTTKAIANQMKAKGLQRLRWYCQACERQMRDENGFKCHVASESHNRKMQELGSNFNKAIGEYSNEFKRDFVQLLRTGHGEKKVNANHFYQEYISNKSHVHMNATRWHSLTDFCKYLGQEGICRVDIDEKNEERGGASALMISWIDNSPEAMRRQEALRKKERQDRGDEHREQRLIEQQIRRARLAAGQKSEEVEDEASKDDGVEEDEPTTQGIKRVDGEKIKLDFSSKKAEFGNPPSPPLTDNSGSPERSQEDKDKTSHEAEVPAAKEVAGATSVRTEAAAKESFKPVSFGASKPKNVFATAAKKNAFAGVKKATPIQQQKPISEAERIMKEELERKRLREERGSNQPFKRQRVT